MKRVNARDFQKSFGRITQRLKAGETVQITKYGKVVGTFTKQRKKVDWDKFFEHLKKNSCPPEVGDELVRKFFNNEFLS